MGSGYLRSRHFVVAASLAALVLAGGASAYYVGGIERTLALRPACATPVLEGTGLPLDLSRTTEDNERRRDETYRLNASGLRGGALLLCLDVGEVHVEPAEGDGVLAQVASDSAAAARATKVEVRAHADGDRLVVAVWQTSRGQARSLFHDESASTRLVLRVPTTGPFTLDATTGVGDVRVIGLLLGETRLASDVGNVALRGVDLQGNATIETGVGDATLDAASVVGGRLRVSADVGNAEALLPQRADVGYDVRASTDVGEVVIRIGDVEASDSQGDGPGERETARSSGYAGKPTKVVVEAATSVGDARVTTTSGVDA